MFTSFSTALSALNANSTAIDVVGNNLANLNTPGFKSSVVYFRDLVTQSLGAGLVAVIGIGSFGNVVVQGCSVNPAVARSRFRVHTDINVVAAVGSYVVNYETLLTVYDWLGARHELTLQSRKTDTNSWTYKVGI